MTREEVNTSLEAEEEAFRQNHAGLVARSTLGHAARGMKIKDQEDMWVQIQHHTFRNWVNVQLRDAGIKVEDLEEDLKDGVALVTLIEVLQKRKLRKVKRVTNQHQALENVTTGLNAIAEDGIKLVNIGNVDIVNGNLKLILGLVWSLIAHYQIGQSTFPPKKFMTQWLRSALPDCQINNFTSDWNSGKNLSALVDYCKPGSCPNWRNLNPNNGTENCRRAMEIAKREFNIPMVLEPEYLSSPYLDDLSGMTYLSYFLKDGGPGYKASLDWVQKTIPECNVTNFTTDWNDGRALSTLIKKLGGSVPGYKHMDSRPDHWEQNLEKALEAGRKLGVEPVLTASDMSKRDVEYLGPMSYVSHYQWVPAREPASEALRVSCDTDNVRVDTPVPFRIDYISAAVERSEVRISVNSPIGNIPTELSFGPRSVQGTFTPSVVGFHEILVEYEEEVVEGCPVRVRVLPDVQRVMGEGGLEPCALGSIVEVLINSHGSGPEGEMDVRARAPSGRVLDCPINEDDGVFTATFQPDEAGLWSIGVTYEEKHIQGSPFSCHVYDPNAIQVLNLDDGPKATPGKPFTLLIDSAACGFGDIRADVTLKGKSEPSKTLEVEQSLYEMTFIPFEAARYRVYIYFNGHECRGSPFSLYLGIEKPPERKSKARKVNKSSKESSKSVNEVIKEYSPSKSKSSNGVLVKTFDNTFESSPNSIKNYGSLNRTTKNKSEHDSSLYSSSTLKSTKTYEKTGKSSSSTYEKTGKSFSSTVDEQEPHIPRIIAFDFGPDSKANFDVNKNALSPISSPRSNESSPHNKSLANKSYSSNHNISTNSDVVDSSFSSTFNTTSSTVVKRSTTSELRNESQTMSPLFNRDSSPHTITNWSANTPPLSPTHRNFSPGPPIGEVGENGPNLSAPSRVSSISKTGPKTTEGKSFFYSSLANMKILPSTY